MSLIKQSLIFQEERLEAQVQTLNQEIKTANDQKTNLQQKLRESHIAAAQLAIVHAEKIICLSNLQKDKEIAQNSLKEKEHQFKIAEQRLNAQIETATTEKKVLAEHILKYQTQLTSLSHINEQQKLSIGALQGAKESADTSLRLKQIECEHITESNSHEQAKLQHEIKKLHDEHSHVTNMYEMQKASIDFLHKAKVSAENSLKEEQNRFEQAKATYTKDVGALKSEQNELKAFISSTLQTKNDLECLVREKGDNMKRMKSEIWNLEDEVEQLSKEKLKLQITNANQKLELDASEKQWEQNEIKYKNKITALKTNQSQFDVIIGDITNENEQMKDQINQMSQEKQKLINEREGHRSVIYYLKQKCATFDDFKKEHEHTVKTIKKKYKERGKRWKRKAMLYLEDAKKKTRQHQEDLASFNNVAQHLKLFAEDFGSQVADASRQCDSNQDTTEGQDDPDNGKTPFISVYSISTLDLYI